MVISEDGESTEMRAFTDFLDIKNLVHLAQKDVGWMGLSIVKMEPM
jgi:hypothetical protein